MSGNQPWPPRKTEPQPVLLQYGPLSTEADTKWKEAAKQRSVQVIQTERFDECLLHAAGARPICLIMPVSKAMAGDTESARLMNPADPIFRRLTIVLLTETMEQADQWSRIAWDALPSISPVKQVELTMAASIETARLRLKDQELVAGYYRCHAELTEEEIVILKAVCDGSLNKQIARELNVSIRTVEQRRRRVFEKMGVESAIPLAAQVATVHTLEHQGVRRDLPAIPTPLSGSPLSGSPLSGFPLPISPRAQSPTAGSPPAPHTDMSKESGASPSLSKTKTFENDR